MLVTPKVYDRLVEKDEKRLRNIIQRKNVTFLILEETDVIVPSMTITDVFTYIYFFNNDGVYDNKIVISADDDTRSWAKELYKYYKKKSVVQLFEK